MKKLCRWLIRWRYVLATYRNYAAALNRRADVETLLFQVAAGRREMLTRDECRQLAIKLGTPEQPKKQTEERTKTMSELSKETINRIIELGAAGSADLPDGGNPYQVIPSGMQVADLSKYYAPQRIKAVAQLTDPASFAAYVNRFKDASTLIFACVTDVSANVEAVLDYHEPGDPRHCVHLARFECQPTTEWVSWMKANGERMDQVGFATWLEEHQELIVQPSGADLLEFIQNLESAGTVRFNSMERLKDGRAKVVFEEDVVTRGAETTKLGDIEVPAEIVAAISPFHGIPYQPVRARLKHRISERKISFWFETVAPHLIVRTAVAKVVSQIEESTQIKPLLGTVKT